MSTNNRADPKVGELIHFSFVFDGIESDKMDVDAAYLRVQQKFHYFNEIILKPEQKDILSHLLKGDDCFGILPTGFGKSLIFTLFPLLKDEVQNVSFRAK
jgi:superfamily II DNA helicase RecQ